jgi:hypothetical protein
MERFAPARGRRRSVSSATGSVSLFQHGMDPQVGDKPLGPITRLEETDAGGYGEVPLLDTSYNRDLLPGLKAGLYGASHRSACCVRRPSTTRSRPRAIRLACRSGR